MSLVRPVGRAMELKVAEAFGMAGRVVIVTGAAGNIGSGIGEVFAANGARVVLSDRAGEGLEKAAGQLMADYPSVSQRAADLTDPVQLKELVYKTVEQFGRLDAIINCGAVPVSGPMRDEDVPDFDRLFHSNVRSIWLLTRYAAEPMGAGGGGSIVNIGSVNGHRALFFCSLYAGTKAAVIRMSEELAVELAPKGIRVNSVSPGLIPNPSGRMNWLKSRLHEPWASEVQARFGARAEEEMTLSQPLSIVGHGHDIGMACYYLCSPAARFVTGTDLRVDGGKLMEMREVEPRCVQGPPPLWKDMREYLTSLPEQAWREAKPHWLQKKA